jgi:hypothetical protein
LALPNEAQAQEFLSRGITTLVGRVDVTDESQVVAFLSEPVLPLPLHVGFLADLSSAGELTPIDRERLIQVIAGGILGVFAENLDASITRMCAWFQLPHLRSHDLEAFARPEAPTCPAVSTIRLLAERLGLRERGAIQLGAAADLIFSRNPQAQDVSASWVEFDQVLLDGQLVWHGGKWLGQLDRGRLLRRNPGGQHC